MASKPHTDEVHRQQRIVKNPIKFKLQLNEEQKVAKDLILRNTLTLLAGSAGSGKTLLACQISLDTVGLVIITFSYCLLNNPSKAI